MERVPEHFWGNQPARQFVAASSHELTFASGIVTAPPFTAACWALRLTDVTSALISFGQSGDANNYHAIYHASTGQISARTRDTASATAVTSTTVASGVWYHACGVWRAVNNRTAYLDGAGSGSNTTSKSIAAPNAAVIGRIGIAGTTYSDGVILWPCAWNAALNDAEIAKLASGTPPWMIRPESIVSCPHMGHLYDPYLGASWTNSGTTLAAPGRIWKPKVFTGWKAPATGNRRRRLLICGSAAA